MAIAVVVSVEFVSAQSKAIQKEAKKAAKSLKKQGWYADSNHTLEYCLARFTELEEENETFVGRASGFGNEKVAKNAARRDAIRESIEAATSAFRGIGDELEGKLNGQAIDNLTMASVSKYEGKIESEMKVSFVLFKRNPDNTFDAQAYVYVPQNTASEARKEAMIDALKETAIAETYINEIEKIVNEKF